MTEKREKIGDYLLKNGTLSQEQLILALEHQKENEKFLGEILVEKGYVAEEEVAAVLAEQFNLPFILLSACPIDDTLKKLFPVNKMKQWKIFPIKLEGDILTVAVTNPLDIKMMQELKYLSGYKLDLAVTTSKEIFDCIHKNFGSNANLEEAIADVSFRSQSQAFNLKGDMKTLEEAVQDAPIVKLVNSVVDEAIKQNASDIHFEPQKAALRIRYRVDGVLYESFNVPKELQLPVISRIKIISGMDISETRRPQDGRMSFEINHRSYDIRTSTLPDSFGEKIVMRILDKENIFLEIRNLGLSDKESQFVKNLIQIPYGIILITGPTGSGKTTTLYSMLNQLNDETRNIVTVENPTEYQLEGINQTEVNEKAGYTFATGMRHILRQDPDVIMIGEIRDLETAEIAVQAALTGHLVLSTLHTNNAAGSVVRLLDMNVEPFLIGSSVVGVVAQRLVRKLCPHCSKEEDISVEVEKSILKYVPDFKSRKFAKPVGCKKCRNIGYQGRTGIFEMMNVTPEIKEMIIKRATEAEIEKKAIEQGMSTLQMSAIEKASQGATSLEEAMRVTFVRMV
ncbi:MAG: ATPase, T2SS/T4P/T4SS family [Candidatus Aceula meridiana]|nr:ATPase, T2SS/T4P/T4SS family [Candidatus Aceula meridiana]